MTRKHAGLPETILSLFISASARRRYSHSQRFLLEGHISKSLLWYLKRLPRWIRYELNILDLAVLGCYFESKEKCNAKESTFGYRSVSRIGHFWQVISCGVNPINPNRPVHRSGNESP